MSDIKSDKFIIDLCNKEDLTLNNSTQDQIIDLDNNVNINRVKPVVPATTANSASVTLNCNDEIITEYNSCQLILSQNDSNSSNNQKDEEILFESIDILNSADNLKNSIVPRDVKKNSPDSDMINTTKAIKQSISQQQEISSSHIKLQLSRRSSTFSSKSRYSNRSVTKKQNSNSNNNNSNISTILNKRQNYQQNLNPISSNLDSTSFNTSNASIYSFNRDNITTNINNINSSSNANLNDNNVMIEDVYCDPGVKEPILIRGAGNITIFGVCNRFNDQFPSQLTAKLAPEEFRDTIKQINNILVKELANSFKWLVFGSLFCCCTLGCSLLPVIFMNKKAKLSINKLLDIENQRLYLKLGLKWRLTKMKCNSSSLFEYVLLVDFLPTILLYQPD